MREEGSRQAGLPQEAGRLENGGLHATGTRLIGASAAAGAGAARDPAHAQQPGDAQTGQKLLEILFVRDHLRFGLPR